MKTIDLHVHSNFSDGTFSPKELILLAKKKGLSAMALTDHDTVSGITPMLEAIKETGAELEFIPGTELSVDYKGTEIHMVGLFLDYTNKEFIERTTFFRKKRENRNEEMVENFRNAGIPMTIDALKGGNPDTVITRAHFAKFLIENGIVKNAKEAFTDKYLGEHSPFYVPRTHMDSMDAIRLLLKADGIPVLAHPMHYKMEEGRLRTMLSELKEAGLVGMETRYSNHTEQDNVFTSRLAKEYGLLPSGGSDFHGKNKPLIELGTGRGNLVVPYEFLEQLKLKKEQGV
ncbi:MAG: PHP domain-containing protein [Lachnospiraceae bacterium]|nr:PHP domain-containing protein [Lachnospiraceae bacterium]